MALKEYPIKPKTYNDMITSSLKEVLYDYLSPALARIVFNHFAAIVNKKLKKYLGLCEELVGNDSTA